MTGPGIEAPGRRAAALLRRTDAAVMDAVLRAPAAPASSWLRPRPGLGRRLLLGMWVVLAAGLSGGSIAQLITDHDLGAGPAVVLGLAQCAPLVAAGRWPIASWRVMAIGMAGSVLVFAPTAVTFPWPVTSCVAMVVVLFQVAACHGRDLAIGAGVVTAAAVIVPAVPLDGTPSWAAILLAGGVVLALVFGDAVGGRYAAEESLAEATALRRADLQRQAVLAERARIARELHDVVAHHMSVIAIQAEAAPYKIDNLPPKALETFTVIRGSAREALAETRRVVGLLREESQEAERVPQPGLDRLDELVTAAEQTGLTVNAKIIGVPRPLSAGVELSAYRIVQEALSNAARHAPGAEVRTEIRYGRRRLRIAVTDDGPGRDATPAAVTATADGTAGAATVTTAEPATGGHNSGHGGGNGGGLGGGHGLVGMRERVTMLGGTLTAGPVDGGGFRVLAELPYGEVVPPDNEDVR